MTYLVVVGASLEAFGHPTECTEPAPGSVTGSSTVSIDGDDVAVKSQASLEFPSHGHDIDDSKDCIDKYSHSFQPDESALSNSVTINGNPAYLDGGTVGTDPGTGGDVNYTDNGGNDSVQSLE